jgi:MoaA/NifB/PqqE/SkfB family radical SAM enzyme
MAMRTVRLGRDKMNLFNTIAVETGAKCNRKCGFCPVSLGGRDSDEYMPDEVFYGIVSELSNLKYKGSFIFHLYNEPMKDKRLADLVAGARRMLPKAGLRFNTNGDYIREPEDIAKYFRAGLNQMLINVYSNEKRYQQLVDMVAHIRGALVVGLHYDSAEMKRMGTSVEVLRKFGPEVYQLGGTQKLQNRSGQNTDPNLAVLEEPLEKYCVRPFRHMNVNWRGDVVLCCNDYFGRVTVGNVRERSLVDLWNDPLLMLYRKKLRADDRRLPLCDKCDYQGGIMPHSTHPIAWPGRAWAEDYRAHDVENLRHVAKTCAESASMEQLGE